MAYRIKKHLSYLEYLNKLDPEQRAEQLLTLKGDTLKFFFNLLLNIVHKKVPISEETKSHLKSHQKVIESLIAKKKSLTRRKKELIQSNIFSDLVSVLLPDLRQAIL